jgi:uncharacterized protein YwgA
MTDEQEAGYVADIVSLAGGKLVGKTRLQKSVYFLETLNLGFGFDFEYHIYGPYSEELSEATELATATQLLDEDVQKSDSGKYSIFTCGRPPPERGPIDSRRAHLLVLLSEYDAITLELAATADFLSKLGSTDDPWAQTTSRKRSKAKPEKIEKAKALLQRLKELSGIEKL